MTRIAKTVGAATRQIVGLLATRNELDWSLASIFYAWSTTSDGDEDAHKIHVLSQSKLPGFSKPQKIRAYRDAYVRALDEGIVADVRPGDEIVIPTATFQTYYDRTDFRIKQKSTPKAKSIQGERQPRVDNNPVIGGKAPRVSSNLERAERILQEVNVMLKAESDKNGIAYQTLKLLKMQAENAVNAYKVAGKS